MLEEKRFIMRIFLVAGKSGSGKGEIAKYIKETTEVSTKKRYSNSYDDKNIDSILC